MTPSDPEIGHERLDVYKHSLQFVNWASEFLRKHNGSICAVDHLRRAATGIPPNIASANSQHSMKERCRIIDFARGSALECAACLDIFHVKDVCTPPESMEGKHQLHSIVNMLVRYRFANANRTKEQHEDYIVSKNRPSSPLFDHEKLDAYRAALRLAASMHRLCIDSHLDARARTGFDTHTTSIVLNIAEGNGRYSRKDRSRFLDTACTAVGKTASPLFANVSETPP